MANKRAKVAPEDVTLRPWTAGDAQALVRLGDDRDIWLNLRERFPRPFTQASADLWLAEHAAENASQKSFAVLFRGQLAGGIHLRRREDINHICADLTFWVGRPFWGRGIASAAVEAATAHAFDALGLERVQAFVFDRLRTGARERGLQAGGAPSTLRAEGRPLRRRPPLRAAPERGRRLRPPPPPAAPLAGHASPDRPAALHPFERALSAGSRAEPPASRASAGGGDPSLAAASQGS
jgi:ribosomal-protein-alanine N-acetyltransferase